METTLTRLRCCINWTCQKLKFCHQEHWKLTNKNNISNISQLRKIYSPEFLRISDGYLSVYQVGNNVVERKWLPEIYNQLKKVGLGKFHDFTWSCKLESQCLDTLSNRICQKYKTKNWFFSPILTVAFIENMRESSFCWWVDVQDYSYDYYSYDWREFNPI